VGVSVGDDKDMCFFFVYSLTIRRSENYTLFDARPEFPLANSNWHAKPRQPKGKKEKQETKIPKNSGIQ